MPPLTQRQAKLVAASETSCLHPLVLGFIRVLLVLVNFILGIAVTGARLTGDLFHATLVLQSLVVDDLADNGLRLALHFFSASFDLILVHDVLLVTLVIE